MFDSMHCFTKLQDKDKKAKDKPEPDSQPVKSASITEKFFSPRGSKSKEKRQSSYGAIKPETGKEPQPQPTDTPKKTDSTTNKEDKKKRRLSLWGK
jgi:hypothetical protein